MEVRRVNNKGEIVIPECIRSAMKIGYYCPMEITYDAEKEEIILRKYRKGESL